MAAVEVESPYVWRVLMSVMFADNALQTAPRHVTTLTVR
ncbi:hypothetical protein G155_00214 [Mycobacterium sp. VKM Ac-1817D]|nr:hypothetical protein G155_00214 [Mycobacterium sp. VKM Ac-1817D]